MFKRVSYHLRSIPVKASETAQENLTLDTVVYVPLNRTYIQQIEIQICDNLGKLVTFSEGITQLLLEIKQMDFD